MEKSDLTVKPRILVADDTRDTADVYCFLLSAAGYRVVRGAVTMLVEDRPLGPDIEAVAALIGAGQLPATDVLAR